MAGPLSKSSLFSILRSHSQKAEPALHLLRRGYHVELGAREKALLEEDPALKKFKSYKNTVKRVSKIGDALSVLAVAGEMHPLMRNLVAVGEVLKLEKTRLPSVTCKISLIQSSGWRFRQDPPTIKLAFSANRNGVLSQESCRVFGRKKRA